MHLDKVVRTGEEARKSVLKGVKTLSDAVSRTLGPYGENGILEKGVRITNDGISIAREIQLHDEIEDLALRKAREASVRANEQAGDGSTTTILLTHKILEAVSHETGSGPFQKRPTADVIRDVSREKDVVIEALREAATPITTKEELVRSAVVSLEDEELGELIGSAQWELGPDGVLIADKSNDTKTTIERVSGIRIDNGLGAMQVVNRPETESLEVKDIPVILTTHIIQTLDPFLESIVKPLQAKGIRKLVIVARAFSEPAILELQQALKSGFPIYPINAPYVNMREVMKDLEAVLGGRFIDHEGDTLDNYHFSDLSHAVSISAKRWEAVFAGNGDTGKRVATLDETLKGQISAFEKKAIETRRAQLKNGFGIVKVGAVSDTERDRVFDKVEDAVNAVKAAFQEGTVKGAGLAFKDIAELEGINLLKQPLLAVHEQIRSNAPSDFEVPEWVRDPVKVLRIALEQAVSVAGDLATVGVAINSKWIRDEKNEVE